MKTYVLILFITFCCLWLRSVHSKGPEEYELLVRFEGLRTARGYVRIAVFDTPQSFLTSDALVFRSIKVTNTSVLGKIDLPWGQYAISAYHDLNSDAALNLNFLGIPKEPYGFSNNPKRGLGPASYDAARFHFDEDFKTLTIELK